MSDAPIGLGTFYHYAKIGGFRGPAIDEQARFDAVNNNSPSVSTSEAQAGEFYPAYFIDELDSIPEPDWLIRDVLSEGTVGMIYGATGSLKTFTVLDLALSAAFLGTWAEGKSAELPGFKIKRPLRVGIVAGEGARGLKKRIRAWRQRHSIATDNHSVAVFPQMPVFKIDAQVAKLIRSIQRKLGTVDLLIVDTVMRAAAGFNLSIPSESQEFLDVCNKVGIALNCAVLLVHHTGKNAALGPLGAENLKAFVDSVEYVSLCERSSNKRIIEIKQEKSKDAELRKPIYMEGSHENLGQDVEGYPLSSLVLERVAAPASPKKNSHEQARRVRAINLIREASSEGKSLSKGQLAEKLLVIEQSEVAEGAEADAQIGSISRWLNTEANGKLKGYANKTGAGKTAQWEFSERGLASIAGDD